MVATSVSPRAGRYICRARGAEGSPECFACSLVWAVVRANRVMVLSLPWSAFATCEINSLVYDVGHWLNAW